MPVADFQAFGKFIDNETAIIIKDADGRVRRIARATYAIPNNELIIELEMEKS